MEYQILLDTNLIYDLIGLNTKKDYINYDKILQSKINISTLSLYEFIENKNKFNKDEISFKKNIILVKQIVDNLITNFEIGTNDNKLLNIELLNYNEIAKIRESLFEHIKLNYIVLYNSMINAFIIFQLNNIYNAKDNTRKQKKKTQYVLKKFTTWFDIYITYQTKQIHTKENIHKFFKKLFDRISNLATHIYISCKKYNALGWRYACRYLRKLQRYIEGNYYVDKNYNYLNNCLNFLEITYNRKNKHTTLNLEDYLINQIIKNIKFKYKDSSSILENSALYPYFKDWLKQFYKIKKCNIWIENDIIDFLISDIKFKQDKQVCLLPISAEKKFIERCCCEDKYKDYIYFDKL